MVNSQALRLMIVVFNHGVMAFDSQAVQTLGLVHEHHLAASDTLSNPLNLIEQ